MHCNPALHCGGHSDGVLTVTEPFHHILSRNARKCRVTLIKLDRYKFLQATWQSHQLFFFFISDPCCHLGSNRSRKMINISESNPFKHKIHSDHPLSAEQKIIFNLGQENYPLPKVPSFILARVSQLKKMWNSSMNQNSSAETSFHK